MINVINCLCVQLAKTVNEVYHKYNRHQNPFIILNFNTKRGIFIYYTCVYTHITTNIMYMKCYKMGDVNISIAIASCCVCVCVCVCVCDVLLYCVV